MARENAKARKRKRRQQDCIGEEESNEKRPLNEMKNNVGANEREPRRQKLDSAPSEDDVKVRLGTQTPRRPNHDMSQPVPPSVPASETITPPHLGHLSAKYTTHCMTVSKNCKINIKVTQLLQNHDKFDIVAVSGRADAGNKLISIVEIVKRDLESSRKSFHQYTACTSRVEEFQNPRSKPTISGTASIETKEQAPSPHTEPSNDKAMPDAVGDGDRGLGSDNDMAFEMMDLSARQKVRRRPILTVFFCQKPVQELARVYSEQKSAIE